MSQSETYPLTCIRVFLADDHDVVRQGLATLMAEEPYIRIVGETSRGRRAVEEITRLIPDVALLDITMPDLSGLEVARELKRLGLPTRSLILTMHEEEIFFNEALRAGAAGYVLKGGSSQEIIAAVRAVHAGGIYLPPQFASPLIEEHLSQHQTPQYDPSLTPRERDILLLIARGFTNSDISEKLSISMNTVKSHRQHIYQKLDIHDRAALLEYALLNNLL